MSLLWKAKKNKYMDHRRVEEMTLISVSTIISITFQMITQTTVHTHLSVTSEGTLFKDEEGKNSAPWKATYTTNGGCLLHRDSGVRA